MFQVPTAPHREGKSTRKEAPGARGRGGNELGQGVQPSVELGEQQQATASTTRCRRGGGPASPGSMQRSSHCSASAGSTRSMGAPPMAELQGAEGRWASLGTVPRGAGGRNSITTGLGQACFIFLKFNKSRGGHGIIPCLPESL